MKKYAIFDLDDTLLDFTRGETEGVTAILNQYGAPDVPAAMNTYLTINHGIWQRIEQGADRGPLLDTRFARTFAAFGMIVDGPAIEAQYKSMLNHNYYTLPGATVLLTQLAQAGVTLIAGTNGTKSVQESRLAGSGIATFFDQIYISEDVGYDKPDQRFFAPIKAAYPAMTATNTLMVGDSLRSDIQGAINAGLANVWFNPHHTANPAAFRPTFEVDSYAGLTPLILD
ncbi:MULTISPECIES: YjjG family noncanonical pyrimidine nucleotidase [Levilactobacillus]|uniref:YjjG family noncanonical pyrimidine nucleotidase n=1 Tax=Levilactobacillus TaxID=2767886 RepID=UPI00194F7F3B|nr:YjjG family noncanonical pyrimidine nucleotidase [Levilactobacillus sp. 244-2]